MFRRSYCFLRPGGARSWKSKTSASSSHFAFVSDDQREQYRDKKKKSMSKEQQQLFDAAKKEMSSSKTLHQQQQQQQNISIEQQQATTQQQQPQQNESARVASRGNGVLGLWQAINPTRNVDLMSKKPWLRRAIVWAQIIKLTEFGHISYYLAPSFIGCGFACTVAIVRESCDTLALQVPFIPLHCAVQSLLLLWSVTSVGSLLEAFFRKKLGIEQNHLKTFDAIGTISMHGMCAVVLLLWHQWVSIEVAMYSVPLIALQLVSRIVRGATMKDIQQNDSQSKTENSNSNKKNVEKLQQEIVSQKEETKNSQNNNNNKPTRFDMIVDSLLLPVPLLMSYASLLGKLDPSVTIPLALATSCWGGIYHTFGGGNALFFSWAGRKRIKLQLMGLTMTSYILLNVAGYAAGQTLFYYVFLGWHFFHLLGVIDHFRPDDHWSVATARRRLRVSMWLAFLAVAAGNFLWLFLVAAVSQIHDVDPEDESNPTLEQHHAASKPIGEQKKTTTGSTMAKVLTLTVQPSPHTSMDQFTWMERIAKPALVYAAIHVQKHSDNNNSDTSSEPPDSDKNNKNEGTTKKAEEEKKNKTMSKEETETEALKALESLEIPVCYRREFFGENFSYVMSKSGIFTKEQVRRFEEAYFGIIDHYSPYGAL